MLPPEHKLPEYQAKGRLYDRFLPTLCLALPQDGETIIDVGANVGDSAIAIVQRCDNPILAIEGDEFYLDYLHRNVTSLPARLKEHITVVPAMIGSGRIAGSLVRDGTTATRSKNAGPALSKSLSLDDLLETRGVPKDSVSLIKVDTDGFDWDVLLSGQKTLHASRPLLYWENQIAPEYAEELKSFYEALGAIGYNHLSIFDNFGNLMLADCGFNELLDLTSYVCRQDHANCERAIYYTDVLAACERTHRNCAERA